MLEICVSLRRTEGVGQIGGSENDMKKVGDIICAKLSPAVWGSMERRYFLLTYLDDPETELFMMQRNLDVYPFKRLTEAGSGEHAYQSIAERCCYKVDTSMFIGTEGLDPSVEVQSPTPPNGKPNLETTDLIISIASAPDNKAVLLQSGGKKAELAKQMMQNDLDIVGEITFVHGDGKQWRHGIDPPAGSTLVDVSSVCTTCRSMPEPHCGSLVSLALPEIRNMGARFVVHGMHYKPTGACRTALLNNVVCCGPILGMTDEEAATEASNRGVEWNTLNLELEGDEFEHGEVIT